jgi:hypothetical protein
MLDSKTIKLLTTGLQRVFAMPVTRSTFREIQTVVITSVNNDKEIATSLFESFFTGTVKPEVAKDKDLTELKTLLNQFSVLVRLSKEVYERGEFVNIITSDTLSHEEKTVFLNRIRRIDGTEFQFITDPESTIHLLHHFTNRLQEMHKNETMKEGLNKYKKELSALKEKIMTAVEL